MILRILNENDLAGLISLEKELFDNPFTDDTCKEELTQSNRLYLGLFEDNTLIGYAGAMITVDTADIIKVGVGKKYQTQGYANCMMTVLMQLLKDNGVISIMLEVESNNVPAIRLYEKCGFEKISQRNNYYGENCHANIMKVEL